jgi:tetratricopeptide (TPR) repeat protein
MTPRAPEQRTNPFPGLRPFRESEEYLFFGRERQVDAMVDKLASTRFLAVVGSSGSGKSSLVNCGLRPALHRGLITEAGTDWRMTQFRPGRNPRRALARALAVRDALGSSTKQGPFSAAELIETTLRISKLGLVEAFEQARLGPEVNLLVVVDQFEELFRYRNAGDLPSEPGLDEEATALVNLLLEARERQERIYVALTMRSDFLGDCARFSGLPEAINRGQYLVPRMSRDERKRAIEGPLLVQRTKIAPVLLTRLVNDVGDDPDQLSILQHSLNRTWAAWEAADTSEAPLDLEHYTAIGTMASALDQHAEEAFRELATPGQQELCAKIFKALTDTGTDARGIRRPTRLAKLAAIGATNEADVVTVLRGFRDPRRAFLMPSLDEPLGSDDIVDISHESLMRVWKRLRSWSEQEALSAANYRRLVDTRRRHAAHESGWLSGPELRATLAWRERQQPNPDWAAQYCPGFEQAMTFLDRSVGEGRKKALRRGAIAGAGALIVLGFLVAEARKAFDDRLATERKSGEENGRETSAAEATEASEAQRDFLGYVAQVASSQGNDQAIQVVQSALAAVSSAAAPPPEPTPVSSAVAPPAAAPRTAAVAWNLGYAAYNRNEMPSARALYEEALQINPRYAPAHNSLGRMAWDAKDYSEAERRYQLALKYDPKYAPALNNLGLLALHRGDLDVADDYAKKALALRPGFLNSVQLRSDIQKRREKN